MSYKLRIPATEKEKADFIVEYNHNQKLSIVEGTDTYTVGSLTFEGDFMFALLPNEIMSDVMAEIDVPDEVKEGEEQTYHKETVILYKPIINPNYDDEQAEMERKRIGNLQVTKRVFMLGLQQMGITYSQLKSLLATNEQAQMEWDLCVELQRKNPLLDLMAGQFGVSSKMLDYIFQKANDEDVKPPESEE